MLLIMKSEDIRKSFDPVVPDDIQKQRMLRRVLDHTAASGSKPARRWPMRTITAMAGIIIVVAGTAAYLLWPHQTEGPGIGLLTPSAAVGDTAGGDAADADGRQEDFAAAPILHQFQMSGRQYILLDQTYASAFGLPEAPAPAEIGEKLTDITDATDKTLVGSGVYRYLPAGCEAVVAVRTGDSYQLYRFFTFDKYVNNADEDAAVYLRLFGIQAAADIAKIEFIRYSEQAKLENRTDVAKVLADTAGIAQFYQYYSVIKDSSAEYFDRLYNYRGNLASQGAALPEPEEPRTDLPPDYQPSSVSNGDIVVMPAPADSPAAYANDTPAPADSTAAYADDTPARTAYDTGSAGATEGGYAAGSAGSAGNALADSVTIRIYNRAGLYYDTIYYPHLGFISRHQVTEEFADFLQTYLQ